MSGAMGMIRVLALAASLMVRLPAAAEVRSPAGEGVDVGKPSMLRNLVPAEQIERVAALQYNDLKRQAAAQKALAGDNHPQVRRLRAIAARITPHVARFNPRAKRWKWEVNLIGSNQVNAFCMPGGKIVFFSGILDTLKLTDDEVAMVMGHEIAHALREHARSRIAKSELTQIGSVVLGQIVGKGRYADAFYAGGNLLTLKFSRNEETEADLVGLELAARAGYDPRAGITLWQKMGKASRSAPPQWLSTHPSGSNRIKEIERNIPAVLPLYRRADDRR